MAVTESRPSALMSLYLAKRADLVRFFAARTSSAAEAEDIVQEMWIKISVIDDQTVENPTAFLYRLGSNVMLDRARVRRRSAKRDDAYYQTFRSGATGGEDQADLPSPEDALDAKARLLQLTRAIEAMPPQRRRVFILHKLEGFSHTQVGETLGISRSAVEKHMIAALKHLGEFRR